MRCVDNGRGWIDSCCNNCTQSYASVAVSSRFVSSSVFVIFLIGIYDGMSL